MSPSSHKFADFHRYYYIPASPKSPAPLRSRHPARDKAAVGLRTQGAIAR